MAKLAVIDSGSRDKRGGGDAVLDVHRGVLRGGALHGDEHDERRLLECLQWISPARSECTCSPATGCPRRLDWNNNTAMIGQVRSLPLQQRAEGVLLARADGRQDIVGGTVGFENAHGTCVGRIKPGPFTFVRCPPMTCRGASVPTREGEFTEDPGDVWRRRRRAHPGSATAVALALREAGQHRRDCARARGTLGEAMDNYLGGISICAT